MRRLLIAGEEALQAIDRDAMAKRESVRALLLEICRPDLAADLDAKYREIDLGIDGARSTWEALSPAQRRVLVDMAKGYPLIRDRGTDRFFITLKNGMSFRACNLPTARSLCARELIAVEGGAFEPESKFVITERGRFVLKHGAKG